MRIINVKQGTDEWLRARLGLPTASNFDRLITKTGKPSASADRYLARLCAEWFMGYPLDEMQTPFMERGSALEAEAVAYYEFETDSTTSEVGLCLTDDGKAGASPDRLVGDDGLLEIKCPSPEVHMGYLLGGLTDEYRVQVQGQLWVTGREWCDLLSFHPTIPRATVRIERDEDFIGALADIVANFAARLDAAKAKLEPTRAEQRAALSELPAMLS